MRILYDGYIFSLQRAGGVNRYFCEIISRLPEAARPTIYCTNRPSLHEPNHPGIRWRTPPPLAEILRPAIQWWSSTFDVFHPSYYHLTSPFDWSSIRKPVVLTVYDFVFSKYATRYERSEKLLHAQSAAIRRADIILCISHSTRADLIERFPETEERSIITHLASNMPPAAEASRLHTREYLLFVGARVFYKNFDLAVEAVRHLNESGHSVDLVVVGPPWSDAERKLLSEKGMDCLVKLYEFPTDEILASLYAHCVALIYPSEYEGFGLPPLEAMTQGAPVLALRTSSLPEVVGAGGILLDPHSATGETFATAAAELLESPARREEISLAAIAQAGNFRWEQTASATCAAYQRAIDG